MHVNKIHSFEVPPSILFVTGHFYFTFCTTKSILYHLNLQMSNLDLISSYQTYYDVVHQYHYIGNSQRKRIIVEQNTEQWHELRTLGSSTVGKWLGIGYGNSTPQEAYEDYFGPPLEQNEHMTRGHEYENVVAYCNDKINNIKSYDGFIWQLKSEFHSEKNRPWNRFSCSPDRCVLRNNPTFTEWHRDNIPKNQWQLTPNNFLCAGVELKAPCDIHTEIPREYLAQTQYQAHIMDVPFVYYCEAAFDTKEDEVKAIFAAKIYKSKQFVDWMMPILANAWRCIDKNKRPTWGRHEGAIPPVKIEYIEITRTVSHIVNHQDVVRYKGAEKGGLCW